MKPKNTFEQITSSYNHGTKRISIISLFNASIDTNPPSVIMKNESRESIHKKRKEKKELKEAENDDFTSFLPKALGSTSSFNSSSTSSTEPSFPKNKTVTLRRRRRKVQTKSSGEKAPFNPTITPQRSSMKKERSSSFSLSRSSSNGSDSRKQRRRRRNKETIKIFLPGARVPVKKQRSIRFDEEVSVREVQSTISLANYNHSILWFQDEENADIKHNLQKLLGRVNHMGVSRSNGRRYCTRGLEHYLDPDVDTADRALAEEAVFHEQSLQRDRGFFDDESIAEAYTQCTKRSKKRAARMGIEDQFIASSIIAGNSFRNNSSSKSLVIPASGDPPSSASSPKSRASFSHKTDEHRDQRHRKRGHSLHPKRTVLTAT